MIRSRIWLPLLAALPVTVAAQTEQTLEQLLELSLTELLQVKVESATLTEQSHANTPASTTIFTRREIQYLGIEYLHELLALVPGYQTSRATDFSYQYTLGARSWKSEASGPHILYLLDGRPLNGPRNGSQEGLFLFPVSQIERLEVIRGPGSAIYGSNAVTGVVNIVTRRSENTVAAALGSNAMRKVELLASHHLDNWQMDLSAYHKSEQGERYELEDTFSPSLISTSDPIELNQLTLNLKHRSNTELNIHYRKLQADDFYNTGRLSNQYNFSEQERLFIGLKHTKSWMDGVTTNFLLDYLDVHSINGNQSSPEGYFSDISEPASDLPLYGYGDMQGRRILLSMQNDWHIALSSSMQFGAEYRITEQRKARGYTSFDLEDITNNNQPIRHYPKLSPGVPISDEASVNAFAFYNQYQHKWLTNWDLTAGLRYDNYDTFGGHLSPRLALIYHQSPQRHFKLLYGEAYRAPNFSETSFQNAISIKGNPDLKPELVKTLEAIWLQQWTQAQLQLSLFNNRFVDPIVDTTVLSVRTFKNGDKEHSQGAELELQLETAEHWLWRFSLTHFWLTPDSAFRESDTLASLQSNYRWDQWNLNLAWLYNSKRQMLLPNEQKSELADYWLLNGKLTYHWARHWRLSLAGKNLFNQEYETPPQGTTLNHGVPNRGRTIAVELSYQFH